MNSGVKSICGFIAQKLKSKYADVALTSSQLEREPQSWTQKLSLGNLTLPSYTLLNYCLILNDKFESYHNPSPYKINMEKGVVKTLCDLLVVLYPQIPGEVITSFIKTRTFIRIKHLNEKMNEEKKIRKSFVDRNTRHFIRSKVPPAETFSLEESDDSSL